MEWLEMAKKNRLNCWKWPEMDANGYKLLEMNENGIKDLKCIEVFIMLYS